MGFDIALERQAENTPTVMEKRMSVSMSDAAVSASSTPDLSPANAKAEIKNTRQAPPLRLPSMVSRLPM